MYTEQETYDSGPQLNGLVYKFCLYINYNLMNELFVIAVSIGLINIISQFVFKKKRYLYWR